MGEQDNVFEFFMRKDSTVSGFNIGDSVIVRLPIGITKEMLRDVSPCFIGIMDKTVGMRGVVCEIGYDKVRVCFNCIRPTFWYREDWVVPAIEFNEEFDMDGVII